MGTGLQHHRKGQPVAGHQLSEYPQSHCGPVASAGEGKNLRIAADPITPTAINVIATASGSASETHPMIPVTMTNGGSQSKAPAIDFPSPVA